MIIPHGCLWFAAIAFKFKTIGCQSKEFNLRFSPLLQGVPTLSEKSNFDTILRKICKISKVDIFSWSQMVRNLL